MIIVVGFLLLLMVPAHGLRVDLANRGCSLNYRITNSTYIFDYCRLNTTQGINNPSWLECCGFCCRLSTLEFPIFDQNALFRCMNVADSSSPPPMIMFTLVSIISMVGLLIVIYAIFKAIKKMRRGRVQPFHIGEGVAIGEYQWQSSNQMEQQQLQTESNIVSKQDKCAICLDDNPNAKLPCLHWFHFHCFLHWMQRTKECPLCRNQNVKNIIVYCKQCKNRYTSIPFKSTVIIIDGLLSSRFGKCDHCKRIEQAEQSFQVFKKEPVL